MQGISRSLIQASVAAAALLTGTAHAQLALTADGITKGFGLTLFADQFPANGFCCGPLGMATNNLGQVVVQDYPNGANYVFNDVDGQHFSNALSSAPFRSNSYGSSITNSGGTLYATNNDDGAIVYKLNPDGSVNTALTAAGAGGHGIWTNFATGHLVAATASSINDIDPATGAYTVIVSVGNIDGVSVSGDGSTIYGATGGHVYGWNYAGGLVYDSGYLGDPDGTGVIQGSTSFAGDIIANDNNGNVWLLDPRVNSVDLIASGGTRGDYVGIDGTNGSLLLSQTDSVYRLTCGPGCTFTSPTPEPATVELAVLGFGVVGWFARRRRRA